LLKENTQITVVESKGRKYLKADGSEGTAVDWLDINLKQGTMLGGLATKHETTQTEKSGDTKTTGQVYQAGSKLVASLDGWELLADEGSQPPWYASSKQKKVKVQVDMPWGVAAIRGTFWNNMVNSSGQSTAVLTGTAEVTSGGVTVPLSGNQSTTVTQPGAPPPPPAPMPPAELQQFVQAQGWMAQTAQTMTQNQELPAPPAPPPAPTMPGLPTIPGMPTTPTIPTSIIDIINQAMQSAGAPPMPGMPTIPGMPTMPEFITTLSYDGGGDYTPPSIIGGTVTSINVYSESVMEVVYGGTLQMYACIMPYNATNQTIAWSVMPLSGGTATIDSTGLLTGTGLGSVRVTATNAASGVTGTQDIEVVTTPSAPAITAVVAAEAGAAEAGFGTGDTLTIIFNVPTNKTAADIYPDKAAVDAVLTFGDSFGTEYSGAWTDNTTLVITSINPAGSAFNVGATVTAKVGAGIKTLNGLSAASTASGTTIGSFELPPAPTIVCVTAAEAGAPEAGFGTGDTLTIIFNATTNKTTADIYPDKAAVDAVLSFSASFGTEYSGAWTDNTTLVITSVNPAGSAFDVGGTVTILAGAGIKTIDGLSAASTSVSGASLGTFDLPPAPIIVSVVAAEAGSAEAGFGTGDTLTITFNVPTNKTAADIYPDKAAVDAVLTFSASFGTDYSGVWTDNTTLVITSINPAGSAFDVGDTVTAKLGADIKTLNGLSAASTCISAASTGTFTP
ncbi:MAG: hypothetical protein CVU90_16115, partial [Firmicutes bacterium HGW-Firmicutes-15]